MRTNQKRQWDVMDQMKSLFALAPLKKVKEVHSTWHELFRGRTRVPIVGQLSYGDDDHNAVSIVNNSIINSFVEEVEEDYSSKLLSGVRQSSHEL